MYNVNDLLLCALPYHATPEFARLLVLLQLKGCAWEWLTPGQQSGAPPPREAIVRRCVNDHVSVCVCQHMHSKRVQVVVSGVAAAGRFCMCWAGLVLRNVRQGEKQSAVCRPHVV